MDLVAEFKDAARAAINDDMRIRVLQKKLRKAYAKRDGRAAKMIEKEIKQREIEVTDALLQREVKERDRRRTLADSLPPELAQEYKVLRNAIAIALDAFETLAMDLSDFMRKQDDILSMEMPPEITIATKVAGEMLKDDFKQWGAELQALHAEEADRLCEIIRERSRIHLGKMQRLQRQLDKKQ